jgi:TonB-dependent starch-binding outer membrane protein SusC
MKKIFFIEKILLIMKLIVLLLFACFINISANVYSQKFTFETKEATIKEILADIESNSTYKFLYRTDLVDVSRHIELNITDEDLSTILSRIFNSDEIAYRIFEDNLVVITNKGNLQQPRITGTITDATTNEPLVGVNILIEGSNIGVVSDMNGMFSIEVSDKNATLIFSYVGYITQKIAIAGQSSIHVKLTSDVTNLDEVVVIGYGSQRKIEVTSAVANVKSDDFIKGSVKDAGQLLQGKVAGLSISTASGDPTASSQILLRGTATLSTSTQPLILVDGIPGDLSTVAPEDIESVDVLKDGSAAAIYGTRGTNGVILIATKKPNGKIAPTITYDTYLSIQAYVRVPKMLTAQGYRQKIAEGVPFYDLGANTDWVKEISRKNPLSHNHNLTFRGGNTQTNYLGTFNYRQLEGVMLKSDYRTINSRVDLNHNMFDDKLKVNFNFINSDYKTGVPFGDIGEGLADSETSNVFNQALYRNPTAPIKNADGSWNEETSISYYENPLGLLMETYGGYQGQVTRISGSVTFEPVEDLRFKAMASRSKSDYERGQGQTKKHLSTIRDGRNGYASKSAGQNTSKILELTGEYLKSFNSHKITALLGYSYQEDLSEDTHLRNWDFPAGNYSYIDNIGAGQKSSNGGPNLMSSSKYASNLIGFFGRVGYNFQEKYLFMANLRYEASSRFVGTKHPWGTFPSISAGWRISEEEFMKGISFVTNLKLRAGYGVTGTAPDELFLGESLLGYSGNSLINGKWVPSLSPTSNPNPDLRWEEKKETNIGLDFGLLAGRISGSIDYYNRKTDGLLYDYSVPTPPNAYGTTKANVGVMENKGLEFLLTVVPVKTNKFSWSSSITFSTNKNKLVSLSNELYATTNPWFNAGSTGSPISTYTHRVEVGKPIGNFYGYKVIDITEDGRWIYEDRNGNPTETSVEEDKKILGNGLPKYFASWNNTLRYGNWDFNLTMRGAFGYQILNYQRMYSENPGFTSYNLMNSAFDKVFGKAVLNENVPVEYNSHYVEDGDFWKIDNVNLGYNFNNAKIKHIGSMRVYFSILNALIISGYKGMDPEVNWLGLTPGNDDRNKYPTTRVYSIGLNITIN